MVEVEGGTFHVEYVPEYRFVDYGGLRGKAL